MSAERSLWLASRTLPGVQKGLHGWLVGYCVECRKVFMLASRILCGVQEDLHGWPVGYCVRAERCLWLAGRILYEEAIFM